MFYLNNERVLAGVFTGFGGLLSLYLGVTEAIPELTVGGLLILNSLMAFFVGEKNGARKGSTE